ncbi:methyltransferase domain-containing protein [Pseudonocardia sp. DSM 110487]|uniref:class I SAM-dependent methyltransferase n=1 Tax=Pseudonocardia sp. DSM 110487 TaxID=2865833 RepID=UPI001C6A0FEE|nr:class I SAM-dependent methyltransferase [Pseudonocardia sp. DSM 110487]QYN37287.1 methyltransferase domain-containing protein [Pseudonocardia sp. DSM 110487]
MDTPPPDDVAGRLLRTASDRHGTDPLTWTASPLANANRVLDVCCGSGPLAGEFPGRWIGVDRAPRPGAEPVVAGLANALPLCDNAVDGAILLLALPRLSDLDGVFAELRRVLRPTGTLVVVVPSASPRSLAELRTAPVHRTGWTNRSALDQAGWLLAAADFAVLGDDRGAFTLPLPDAATARALVSDLSRAGWWPPDLAADVRERVASGLARRAGPGRVLPVPLRRLVARR